jgi:hypothetical protein
VQVVGEGGEEERGGGGCGRRGGAAGRRAGGSFGRADGGLRGRHHGGGGGGGDERGAEDLLHLHLVFSGIGAASLEGGGDGRILLGGIGRLLARCAWVIVPAGPRLIAARRGWHERLRAERGASVCPE